MRHKVIKKWVLFLVVTFLVIIGVRAYLLKDYVTVVKYDPKSTVLFISRDSIMISPFLYIENTSTLASTIDFESVSDSLLLENLNVTVYSPDNPWQSIHLSSVSAVVHPVMLSGGRLARLEANSFNALPVSAKTIRNSGLPYNKITFYFKTRQLRKANFYHFKIEGSFIYKGQRFKILKEIRTERKLEYQPYRMMT